MTGIQGVKRVLKNHLKGADLLGTAVSHGNIGNILTFMAHLAFGAFFKTHQYFGKGGFATAGFTDNGYGFTFPGGKVQFFIGFYIFDSFAGNQCFYRAVAHLIVFFHTIDIENPFTQLENFLGFLIVHQTMVIDFFIA